MDELCVKSYEQRQVIFLAVNNRIVPTTVFVVNMARKRICNRKQATIWMEGFENSAYRWELRAENRSWSVARVVYHIAMWVSNPRALFFAFQLILDPSYSSWCVSCKELSWVLSKQARPICSAFVFFNQRNSFKLGRKWKQALSAKQRGRRSCSHS